MSNGTNNGHDRNGTGNALVHVNPRVPANGNGTGHGVEHDAANVSGHDFLWDGLSPAVTSALAQPLDPDLVSKRRGRAGRTFSYIEGHVAISEANRVFGYGGWGYELLADVTLREIANVDPDTGEVKLIRAYSAPVRVTVPGAPPRTDVGFHAVTEETPDGHETALKGAVTDGLKRALRSFGDRFGNGLYGEPSTGSGVPGGKTQTQRVPANSNRQSPSGDGDQSDGSASGQSASNGHRSDESQVEMLRRRLFEIATEQGFDEDGVRAAVVERTGKGVDELTAAELAPLVKAADNKLRQLKQAA